MSQTQTASSSRTSDYTEAHSCRGCHRVFWAKRSWNGVNVKCPHCSAIN